MYFPNSTNAITIIKDRTIAFFAILFLSFLDFPSTDAIKTGEKAIGLFIAKKTGKYS